MIEVFCITLPPEDVIPPGTMRYSPIAAITGLANGINRSSDTPEAAEEQYNACRVVGLARWWMMPTQMLGKLLEPPCQTTPNRS